MLSCPATGTTRIETAFGEPSVAAWTPLLDPVALIDSDTPTSAVFAKDGVYLGVAAEANEAVG